MKKRFLIAVFKYIFLFIAMGEVQIALGVGRVKVRFRLLLFWQTFVCLHYFCDHVLKFVWFLQLHEKYLNGRFATAIASVTLCPL